MTIKDAIQRLFPSACVHTFSRGVMFGLFYQVIIRRSGADDLVLSGGETEDEAWALAAATIMKKASKWR